MQEVERLVKMANQIADNFGFHDDADERIVDHLQRFWAPSMWQKIVDYDASGGDGLQSGSTGRHTAAGRSPMNSLSIAGTILAGGRSSRMVGRNKVLAPLAGRPLIRHVIDRVAPQVAALALSVETPTARTRDVWPAAVAGSRARTPRPIGWAAGSAASFQQWLRVGAGGAVRRTFPAARSRCNAAGPGG